MQRWIRDSLIVVLVTCAVGSQRVAAQGTTDAQPTEVAPLACYWRTSTDAVRVGEPFTLVLTCSVLDTAATTVVPDQSRLDPGVMQLQPFEVRGGTQAPDLRSAARRYFQYEYQLRYVGEEVGRDLQLPALTLTYRVQSRVQQDGSAVEGRERQYILPAHAIRILSTVPATARDIRETSPVTLADIDARRFRASMLRVVAWALYAVGGVVALWALVSFARRRRDTKTMVVRHASDAAVLAGVARELEEVRRARGAQGWTEALAARALAALRIGAAYDAGLMVAQVPMGRKSTLLSGQLAVSAGWTRRGRVVVSGAATPVLLARLRSGQEELRGSRRARIDDLERVLTRFSQAAYGRDQTAALDDLDESFAVGERAISGIRREHSWLATQLRALRERAGDQARARGWARS